MSAGLLAKSSGGLGGKCVQPLGPDAVALLTPFDKLSLQELQETLLVTLVTLTVLQSNTHSPDVRSLSYIHAARRCQDLGVPDDRLEATLQKLMDLGKSARDNNPISSMF